MPRVSIGLPVYNGAQYIGEAVSSILAQTYGDFELIISDNGSTDVTPQLCRQFAARDGRIRLYLNEENRGAAWNYNRVFALASGEFFKWASHDDLIAPTYIERCVEVLDGHPDAALCYPKTLLIDASGGNPIPYADELHLVSADPVERFRNFLFRKPERCNAVLGLARRAVLARTSLIGHYNSSDRVLLAHLALLGTIHELPEALFSRRVHPQASLKANTTAREVAAWFDPSRRHRLVLPLLRRGVEYLRCIRRADLGLGGQLACARLVARRYWWDRRKIADELKTALCRELPG